MKVVDTYSEGGYICFQLDDGSVKRFADYWAFSNWLGAKDHQELQDLMKQAVPSIIACSDCGNPTECIFPPKEGYVCIHCQMDRQLLHDLELYDRQD